MSRPRPVYMIEDELPYSDLPGPLHATKLAPAPKHDWHELSKRKLFQLTSPVTGAMYEWMCGCVCAQLVSVYENTSGQIQPWKTGPFLLCPLVHWFVRSFSYSWIRWSYEDWAFLTPSSHNAHQSQKFSSPLIWAFMFITFFVVVAPTPFLERGVKVPSRCEQGPQGEVGVSCEMWSSLTLPAFEMIQKPPQRD